MTIISRITQLPTSFLLIPLVSFLLPSNKSELFKHCEEVSVREYGYRTKIYICSYYQDPLDTTSIVARNIYHDIDTSKIYIEEKYSNQKLSGIYKRYHHTGELYIKGKYVDGLKEGKWISFKKNGDKSSITLYQNGKANGVYTEYHKNGILSKSGFYKDGERIGRWIEHYSNGQIKSNHNYKTKSGISYYEGGNISSKTIKLDNGGVEKINYTKKNKIRRITRVKDRRAYETFNYDQFSGILKESHIANTKTNIVDLKLFFDDGEIKLKGQYFYNTQPYGDVLRRPNSYRDRTGEWITYNPHGGIESTEDWSDIEKEKRIKALHNKYNNKRINSNPDKNDGPYSITQKGVIVEEGSYFSKMQDGIIKRYNKNGSIIEMSFYRDGRRDSVQTTYGWDNQIIMKEEWYKDGLKHGKSFKYNDYIKRDTGNKETYLWSVRDYSNGNLDGKAISYSRSGIKIFETNYIEGKRHGLEIQYHQNVEEEKISSISKYNMGVPTGEFIAYNKDGLATVMYSYDENGLKTGIVAEYHNNSSSSPCGWEGDITKWKDYSEWVSKGEYFKGKKHGKWITHSLPDTTLASIIVYESDEEVSSTLYHSNGTIWMENVDANGDHTSYYDNGNIQMEQKTYKMNNNDIKHLLRFYENGIKAIEVIQKNQRDSSKVEYYSNGQLRLKKFFTDGIFIGKAVHYYENGQIEKVEHYDNKGKRTGVQLQYYDNGNIKRQDRYSNGRHDGEWVSFYKNGKISLKRFYVNGIKQGPEISYHRNGMIRSKGVFKDNTKKDESFSYYDDGTLKEKANYEDGKYHGDYAVYFENGGMKDKGKYHKGKKTGHWVCYYKGGGLMGEADYDAGKLHGIHVKYNKDGKVKSKWEYSYNKKIEDLN